MIEDIEHIEERENKKNSAMISVIVHLLLLLILLSPCFSFMSKKQPPESGIYVALGNPMSETVTEKLPSQSASKTTPNKSKAKTKVKETKPSASKSKPTPAKSSDKIQSEIKQEKADFIASKKKKEDDKKAAENARLQNEKLKKEQEEREREAAEEKQRQEEEARKAAEAAKRKAKEDAKSKFSSLLGSANQEGETSKGQENGKPNAKALEGITTGYGHTGEGMGDRKLLFAPTIKDDSQKKGRVVVEICVGKNGKVTKAKYTQKGSTTTDSYLISLAEKNAKKYKFEESQVTEQCGDIIIDFKLK